MPDNLALKHLLDGIVASRYDNIEKHLAFYRLVIDLERSKEPDIQNYFDYPVNYKDERIMLIDFPCNNAFYQKFEVNRDSRATKFPNDLYVGLMITTGGKGYRLLNFIIGFEDIKDINIDKELLPIRISNFEINLKEAGRLELLPEKIENINNGIKANPTLQGVLGILREEIAEDVKITDAIYLALSSKSIELSQIYSELNNQRLSAAAKSNPLLKSFLLNHGIENKIEDIDTDGLIQITELDEDQKKAIATALSSKVSVITGPPGTGKTQVIENILANALIKGKKVLVASKNNKAVDNVKERFDKIDKTGYFLRFGSKQRVNTDTLPEIQRILTEISTLQNNDEELRIITREYENGVRVIKENKAILIKKERIAVNLPLKERNIHQQESIVTNLATEHKVIIRNIEKEYSSIAPLREISKNDLDRCMSELKKLRNIIVAKFTGTFGFWYNWFSKKKYAMILLNTVESFPYQLKSHISSMSLVSSVEEFNTYKDMTAYCTEIEKVISRVMYFHRRIDEENRRYSTSKRNADRDLERMRTDYNKEKEEFDNICSRETTIKKEIQTKKKWIDLNGRKMVDIYIHHFKIQQQAVRKINTYKSYLPSNIPWRDNEYSAFIQRANDFLDVFHISSVTSLSIKNAFPMETELFDMVVIDEASQCDVASALPLIMRTKQLVVIGDPMQLRHITSIKPEEEEEIKKHLDLEASSYLKYSECSLWDFCQSFISESTTGLTSPIMLQGHYRCHPDIIGYSNEVFYGGKMGHALNVNTDVNKLKGRPEGIVIIDVKGTQVNDNVNVNEKEAQKSIDIAINVASRYPDVSIGIVTPFRHQAERINSAIPPQFSQRIEANTVHKYQGDEKDIMIYSLVVTNNSPEKKIRWIDYSVPNLVNVAVTRAKSTLYVVCNVDYIKSHSSATNPLGHLVRYNA